MKKILSLLLLFFVLSLSVLTLASCNVIQPGKLSAIAGTYVLDEYKITTVYDKDGNRIPEEEQPVSDKIAEYGIVEYYVITEEGYGYHVYKDNDTALSCKEVKQGYVYNSDDPVLIDEITFYDGDAEASNFYVQSRKHTMTNNSGAWHSDLKFGKKTVPIGKDQEISLRYKRVSKKQDLSYAEKKIGSSLSPESFLKTWLPDVISGSGSLSGDNVPFEDLFVYDYYVVNKETMVATRYYAMREDGEQKTESVSLSYDLAANTLTVGERVYSSYTNNNTFSFTLTETLVLEGEVASRYYQLNEAIFSASEVQSFIDSAMESYRLTKPTE